jgi:hypothetical protein
MRPPRQRPPISIALPTLAQARIAACLIGATLLLVSVARDVRATSTRRGARPAVDPLGRDRHVGVGVSRAVG